MVMTSRNELRKAPRSPSQLQAAKAIDELRESGALDSLFSKIDAGQIQLTGEGGFIPGLLKAALERGLQVEKFRGPKPGLDGDHQQRVVA